VPSYLVEVYLPRSRAYEAPTIGSRARDAAEALSGEGTAVHYVRTTLLPEDETCFYVFEAASYEAVAEACRLAGLGTPRIVLAEELVDDEQH
jgi:hypothetical protein